MRQRTKQLKIWVTESEYSDLKHQSEMLRIPFNQYVLRLVNEKQITIQEDTCTREMINSVNKIGGLINQIAAKANSTGIVTGKEIRIVQELMRKVIAVLKGAEP